MSSDSELNSLRVLVRMCSPLARVVNTADLGSAITGSLQDTLKRLGIPDTPDVQVSAAEDVNPHLLLDVTANGIACRQSEELVRRIFHYETGTYLEDPLSAEKLTEEAPEHLLSILRSVCIAALEQNPAVLLTGAAVETYRQSLSEQIGEESLPPATWLHPLLAEVLKLAISIENKKVVASVVEQALQTNKPATWAVEEMISALRPDEIQVQVHPEYLKELTLNGAATEFELFKMMRDGLFYELGIHFPAIRFVETEDAAARSIRIKINSLTMSPWKGLAGDELLVNDTVDRLKLIITEIQGSPNVNPATGRLSATIAAADKQKAEEAGLTTWTPLGYLVLIMSHELRAHAARFMDSRRAQSLLDQLNYYLPELVKAALARFTVEQITGTLRLLLNESLSIRNLRQVLQGLVDFNYIEMDSAQYIIFAPWLPFKNRPTEEALSDPVNLAAHVRSTMKAYISHKYTAGRSTLVVALLSPDIESWLFDHRWLANQLPGEDELAYCDRIVHAVFKETTEMWEKPAILTTIEVRQALREIIAPAVPRVPVLSYQELSPEMNIQPVVRISLS